MNAPDPSPDVLIRFIPEGATTGGAARSLRVPDGHAAIVLRTGKQPIQLGTGDHVIRSAWDAVLGRDVPPVWLVQAGTVMIEPFFARLLTADGQLVVADMLVQARIARPQRVWEVAAPVQGDVSNGQFARLLAARLQPVVQAEVRRYPWDSLQHLPESRAAIEKALMASLRGTLTDWGLELIAVSHFSFLAAQDAVEVERAVQSVNEQLAMLQLQAESDRLEQERLLRELRAELDPDLTEAEKAKLDAAAAEEKPIDAAVRFLGERLDRLEQTVNTRLDTMAQSQPQVAPGQPQAAVAPPSPPAPPVGPTAVAAPLPAPQSVVLVEPGSRRLETLVMLMRLLSAVVWFLVVLGTIYFPHIVREGDGFRLLFATTGVIVAILAFVGSGIFRHRARAQRQRRVDELARALQDASLQERLAQERGIRRYFELRLRQVADNCRQTWQRVYEPDIKLATGLRQHCEEPYTKLADRVKAADYRTGRYLTENVVPAEDMAKLLALSEALLNDAEGMVDRSLAAYNTAMTGDLATVWRLQTELDQGCLAIANRFGERERFLMD